MAILRASVASKGVLEQPDFVVAWFEGKIRPLSVRDAAFLILRLQALDARAVSFWFAMAVNLPG